MRHSHIAVLLLSCCFSLIAGPRPSAFARQSPQMSGTERGIELYRKGSFGEAAKALKETVKNQKSDPDAWYYLGLSLHRLGKIKDARKAFEKALSLRPDFAQGYSAIAFMHLLGNNNKEALRNAEKSLALDPKNLEALYIAGTARLRENAAAAALARAEEALKINPDYPEALLLKTQALVNMFSQRRANRIRSREWRESSELSAADGEAKRRAEYSLLKTASESLEAYLKLRPERSEQAFWREQLEALRAYAQMGADPGPDTTVVGMSASLRPKILYRERAVYTQAARDAGVQGTVTLLAVFADDGLVKHIMVLQPLSHGLTEQAILAARKIRFAPAMRDGKPVSVVGTLEFTFNLYKETMVLGAQASSPAGFPQ